MLLCQLTYSIFPHADTQFGRYLPAQFEDGKGEPKGRDASLYPLGQFRQTDWTFGAWYWNWQYAKYMRKPNVSYQVTIDIILLKLGQVKRNKIGIHK